MNLVVLFIIFVSELYFVSSQVITKSGGFCVYTINVRESKWEPYTYTITEVNQERCGWGFCHIPRTVTKTDMRYVYKDVPKTSVTCCSGYQKSVVHGDHYSCVPICDPPCEYGHCSAPGNCTCSLGFIHLTSNVCVPHCDPDCVNGRCEEPGACSCLEGFKKINSTHCEPECVPACVNGICTNPNTCACNNGYKMSQSDWSFCEPICTENCVNSTCTGFNECTCLNGFVHETPQSCKPFCVLECIHGDCSAPDVCTCEENYHLANEYLNNCVPDCNCTNGYCTTPNECTCFDNYTLNEEGDCEPVCDECINSTCTSPNLCECFDGYTAVNISVCVPKCSNCEYGMCTEPEVCTCFEGYQNLEFSCTPICKNGCWNGFCSAPEKCTCEAENDVILENVCFPVTNNCSNSSEIGCFTTEDSFVYMTKEPTSNPSLNVHINVDCSHIRELYNSSCVPESQLTQNCSETSLECMAIKSSSEPFIYLCFWKDENSSLEEIYHGITEDVLFTGNLSSDGFKEKIKATIILPAPLKSGDGDCNLCSSSKIKGWKEGTNVNFQLVPCPSSKKNKISYNEKGHSYIYVIAAAVCGTILLLTVLALIVIKKQNDGVYVVGYSRSELESGLVKKDESDEETAH